MKVTIYALSCVMFVISIMGCYTKNEETIEQRVEKISRSEMQGVLEFVSHDLLEGRAPGTRGSDLAVEYLYSLFKFMDLKPGNGTSYSQVFDIFGFQANEVSITSNGIKLKPVEDIMGSFTSNQEMVNFEREAVFVGFGIKADTWDWNDYKNVDVKDKIVITRVNDPGFFNPDIFEGKTLTYYGRWTYHIEEAARRGAAGIIMIHNDKTAGYSWKVVKNSWSGEEFYLESELQNNLNFRGWIKENSLKKLLKNHNFDLDDLYNKSLVKEFQPVNLGFKLKITGKNKKRKVRSKNVVAEIKGKTEERIVLSAHIDHIGMSTFEEKDGDYIYNGAIDNSSAVAALMIVAKILKEFQDELYYSVTILGCNAEESGLLGSKYYSQNADRKSIIANINFEATPVWGMSKSIIGIGARFSDFEEIMKALAKENEIEYTRSKLSDQGFFYRSDQYSFARFGIPSIWITLGEEEISGEKNMINYFTKDYHTVNDEFNPEWKLEGMKQTIKYALLLIDHFNKSKTKPKWKKDIVLPFPLEK